MKNDKKLTFWQKIKYSIIDFEKYQELAAEKIIKTVGYIAILVFIFTFIMAFVYTYKTNNIIANVKQYINNDIKEINFENNELKVISKNNEENIKIKNEELGIDVIINTSSLDDNKIDNIINQNNLKENAILILKDKVIIKNQVMSKPLTYMYKDIAEKYNINKIDKQEAIDLLSSNTVKAALVFVFGILLIYFFIIIYFPTTLIDIFVLSILGYIVSIISRLRLKYSAIYNISAYSITLSIILNMVYFIINSFTGFTIKYFDVMYTTIATIYITAAILLIRSDVIKKQIELTKIIEEQDKVRLELERRKEEEKEQEEKEKQKKEEDKKEKKKKEDKNEDKGTQPEGDNV